MSHPTLSKQTIEAFSAYMNNYPELYKDLATTVEANTPTTQPLILDLGSGPGLLTKEIKRRLPNAQLIALDPSQDMLLQAQHLLLASPTFTHATVEHLPFKENTFDTVVTRYTLTYWNNPLIGLSEIHRILKPQGRFILEALNKDYPTCKRLLTTISMKTKKASTPVIKYHFDAYRTAYTIPQTTRYLQQSGFSIRKTEGKPKEWRFQIIAEKNINTSQT